MGDGCQAGWTPRSLPNPSSITPKGPSMDAERFDAMPRTIAGRISRRVALRGAGAGALSGLLAFGWPGGGAQAWAQSATPTSLPICADPSRPGVGRACTTGTEQPCGDTALLCCANDANAAPGSPGTCTPSSIGCNPLGPPSACTSHGCRCQSGTDDGCDTDLVCCPDNPGLPGGPGRCVKEEHCNTGDCQEQGCACQSGTRDACSDGLVCCAHDSSMPGSNGRCEVEAVCFAHQCQATTDPCPSACTNSTFCKDCCSGYRGPEGYCATPVCEGIGCPCTAGVEGTCSAGLVCCQSQMTAPNTPGGPGMCAAPDACGNAASPEATAAS